MRAFRQKAPRTVRRAIQQSDFFSSARNNFIGRGYRYLELKPTRIARRRFQDGAGNAQIFRHWQISAFYEFAGRIRISVEESRDNARSGFDASLWSVVRNYPTLNRFP